MNEKTSIWPVGSRVRVKDPDAYIRVVANRYRDRIGVVVHHQFPRPNPIVKFDKEGRRKEITEWFYDGDLIAAEDTE